MQLFNLTHTPYMENKQSEMKTAKQIAKEIFYLPATNGQSDASIELGAKMIEEYASQFKDRESPPVTGTADEIRQIFQKEAESWYTISPDNHYINTDGNNNAILIQEQEAFIKGCEFGYQLQSTAIEMLTKALYKLAILDEDKGIEGCTYGDTDYDSMSAAYGFNQCVSLVNKIAREALASIKK